MHLKELKQKKVGELMDMAHSFNVEKDANGIGAWELGSPRNEFHESESYLKKAGEHGHVITGGDTETRPINAYVFWIIRTE